MMMTLIDFYTEIIVMGGLSKGGYTMYYRCRSVTFTIPVLILLNFFGCSEDWITLFDGESLEGWTALENPDSWKVEKGVLIANGPRSHLFYTGDVNGGSFKNFEFEATVKTEQASNSGIFFHTKVQESGWPKQGYECQVLNSHPDVNPGSYMERKMTGSIYGIRNVWKSPAHDEEWFHYRIRVQGKTIQSYINGNLVAEYTEFGDLNTGSDQTPRRLGSGTFALQAHDPDSKVYYKKIRVKPLPDELTSTNKPLNDKIFDSKLISLGLKNFPLMDLHVHLKQGLKREEAFHNARKYGFTYGIAVNCGIKMGFETNDALEIFLQKYEKPVNSYLAMQAEGREWLELFKPETVSKFDYVFTDAMTWTNNNGKRMRLWIKEETEIGDPQDFMEQLVDQIEIIMTEPIDIYVNPTYLPEEIAHLYDTLWTKDRMDRVIAALLANNVALEINARRQIPSPVFIKRAKVAGVKFTFGTNNGGKKDLGRLDYCIEMIEECGLEPDDMWYPEMKKNK